MARERHDHDSGEGLIPVEQHRDTVLAACQVLPSIELPLLEAVGCVCAADVVSTLDLPPFASSALDGFAVRGADTAAADGETTVTLRIVGRSSIGHSPDATVGPGEAVRVATGSVVPVGADAIVPIEDCIVRSSDAVEVMFAASGRAIRPAAQDVREGDLLVAAGKRIGAPDVALLASAGVARVGVYPKPRVAVLSTGDELVDPGKELAFGQIFDSNSVTLAAAIREGGGEPFLLGHVQDDVESLRELVQANLGAVDAFVTTGGVSVGEHDPVKAAFLDQLTFSRVAMQPGMPQGFGVIEDHPFFCLPGNPVSAFVSFEVFVRPALLKMAGRTQVMRPIVTAMAGEQLRGPEGKLCLARVQVKLGPDGYLATSAGPGGSNLISTVARANGLAMIPPGVRSISPGGEVQVMIFRAPND